MSGEFSKYFVISEDEQPKSNTVSFLRDYQWEAVQKAKNGCIFNGSVGSGKSRTGLYYYFNKNGGDLMHDKYVAMSNPHNLYIITTAKKRDSLEWEEELIPFRLSKYNNQYDVTVVIDSWNNIQKYTNVYGSQFIFDEDHLTGNGQWVKAFYKIAKKNEWVILSATPGDSYIEYAPVFIANGFFKNITEFKNNHVVYSQYTKYPKIERYINIGRLDRLRQRVLIDMPNQRDSVQHHETVYVDYNHIAYKRIIKDRWNIFDDKPIETASEFCYTLRKLVNSDESRVVAIRKLIKEHPKSIIFYNHDYELEILRNILCEDGKRLEEFTDYEIAEWNGHIHQEIPHGNKWVYLCHYTSAEGWNCIRTDTVIFYSQNYSYKMVTQAAGRIDRMNTPFHDLYYYHLKSRSGIDLAIGKALAEKKQFNEKRFDIGFERLTVSA